MNLTIPSDLPPDVVSTLLWRLQRPNAADWTVQGLGMMRTCLDEAKIWRLHVWSSDLIYTPEPSTLHTHPWAFTSYVLSGEISHTRWGEYPQPILGGMLCKKQKILCGPGGHAFGAAEDVQLLRSTYQSFEAGHSYSMEPDEIHESNVTDGAITLIRRTFGPDTETAFVYYNTPAWVSAEPRPATEAEVLQTLKEAEERWS